MAKKLIALGLVLVIIISFFPVAFAHGKQSDHDKDLREFLFGQGVYLTGEKRDKFEAIADAAALCIDQFSTNEEKRSKEDLFNELDKRIGFSFTFDDIELQKYGDKNVTAKTHRLFTHRGWNYSEYPLPKLWTQRKKILTATVNKELFGKSPGMLKKFKWVEGLVYSEEACNKQCEAFCELVYYVHILGDYVEATSYSSEFQQLIPLVRHEDPTAPAMIDELIKIIPVLFESQRWSYPTLIQELERIKADAEAIMFVQGGIRTQEQFNEYHSCALELINVLKENLPGLLKNTDFFKKAFY